MPPVFHADIRQHRLSRIRDSFGRQIQRAADKAVCTAMALLDVEPLLSTINVQVYQLDLHPKAFAMLTSSLENTIY